jgi:hypothetical protein
MGPKLSPRSRDRVDGIQKLKGADPLLTLAHELVGHGFQANVRQLTPLEY